ncbi:hypothetical protein ACWD4J_30890 [Streptomyces sp. NPDC002577]
MSPAALPLVALRVVRTAAGRRALRVMFLLGGLFVLGVICGERAHAAESRTAAVVSPVRAPEQALSSGRAAEPGHIQVSHQPQVSEQTSYQAHRAVRPAVRPVAESALETVGGAVDRAADVQTGEGAGESAARAVGRLVDTVTGALSAVSPTADPDWPDLHGLHGLPGLPGLPSLPGGALPGGDLVQPPQSGAAEQPSSEAAVEDGAGKSPAAGYGPAYGPRTQVGVSVGCLTDRHDGGAVRPEHAPARTPGGEPAGAIVNQSLFDTSSPRHGDLHAASVAEGAPFRLVPGGIAATDDADVRDRHRDINEFPG